MLAKLEEATDQRFTAEANASRERLVLVSGELAEKIGIIGAAAKQEMDAHRDRTRRDLDDKGRVLIERMQDVETLVLQEKEDRDTAVADLRERAALDKESCEDLFTELDGRFSEHQAAVGEVSSPAIRRLLMLLYGPIFDRLLVLIRSVSRTRLRCAGTSSGTDGRSKMRSRNGWMSSLSRWRGRWNGSIAR